MEIQSAELIQQYLYTSFVLVLGLQRVRTVST